MNYEIIAPIIVSNSFKFELVQIFFGPESMIIRRDKIERDSFEKKSDMKCTLKQNMNISKDTHSIKGIAFDK